MHKLRQTLSLSHSHRLAAILQKGSTYNLTWAGSDAGVTSYSVYLIGGSLGSAGSRYLGTAYTSQGSFSWTVPSDITAGPDYRISFSGAGVTGNYGASFTIVASDSTPILSSLSPLSVASGGTVYVYGSNFGFDSYINVDGIQSITPSSYASTLLTFAVPSSVSVGTHTIRVGQKAGYLSNNSASLTVIVPASTYNTPVISSINPASVTAGGTIFVYGSNFDQSSYVVLDGNYPSIVPSSQANTYLTFVVPSNTTAGSHSVQVGVKASSLSNSVSLSVVSAQSVPISTPTPQSNQSAPLPADVDTQNPQGACLDLQNNLRYRTRDTAANDDVASLQDYLQASGYLHTDPSGFFGILTLKAVKDFQQANGISPTGFVGSITRAKIKTLSCK